MLNSNPDLINSCRVCRSPNQNGDYECLYQNTKKHGDPPQLSEAGILYENLLNISLSNWHNYPQFLCNSCDLQMKLFKKLKEKAYKTWEYLQNLYEEQQQTNVKQENKREVLDILEELEEEETVNDYQENASVINEYQDPNETEEYQEYATNVYESNSDEKEDHNTEDYTVNEYEIKIEDKPEHNTKEYQKMDEYEESHDKLTINEQQSMQQEDHVLDSIQSSDVNSLMEENPLNIPLEHELQQKITELKFHYSTIEVSQNGDNSQVIPQIRLDLEPVIDKNDYVTEIYELLEEEDKSDNCLENNDHNIEYDEYTENKTETSSIITDVEYIIEEEMAEEIQEMTENKLEIESLNKNKRKSLNSNGTRKRTNAVMVDVVRRKRVYKCEICQLEFKNLLDQKQHRYEVHKEKFLCNICGKELRTSGSLRLHMKIHADKPEHQCEICQKTFNQKAHYQYHMKLHNNERNFKCTECEKTYITKTDLKIHQRTHTGQRPYVCSFCNKDYLMMEHLNAHLLTHTEQYFECDICKHKFSTHKTLRQHVKTIHEDEPRFKCSYCGKAFRRKHHLQYHMKLHQNNVKLLEQRFVLLENAEGEEEEIEDADDLPESELIVDSGFIALNDDVI